MAQQSVCVTFDNNSLLVPLFGEHDRHLMEIENKIGVIASYRGNVVSVTGSKEKVDAACDILRDLYQKLEAGQDIELKDVTALIRTYDNGMNRQISKEEQEGFFSEDLVIKTPKKYISAHSKNQRKYIQLLMEKDMVFATGVAGTGKTYLAVAVAIAMFTNHKVERIILSRPAVEAGEKIGFLPGDMKEKVDPYLRPLYDALFEMMQQEKVNKYIDMGIIEIAPLAFMRGRTLNNAFIILDEAQNATPVQMKMFLTRLGEGSHMAITGDPTQIDLPKSEHSGLIDACERLNNIEDIGFMNFTAKDIVRHSLTTKIIQAYAGN